MSPYRRHTPVEAQVALDRLETALKAYRAEHDRLAMDFADAVAACVEAHATWGEVGMVVGMTKQAARAHWGPYLANAEALPQDGRFLHPSVKPGPRSSPDESG